MPRSFAPVVGRSPRVLILGSMPGAESLRRRQYYGHPRNQFWRLLGDAAGVELAGLSYPRRLAALKRLGVALWDTLEACAREGSLDSAITEETPNEVARLVRARGVRAVFLNGGKARQVFARHAARRLPPGVAVVALPSSSPAAAALSYAAKLRRWRRIGDFLSASARAGPGAPAARRRPRSPGAGRRRGRGARAGRPRRAGAA